VSRPREAAGKVRTVLPEGFRRTSGEERLRNDAGYEAAISNGVAE
jgi:hypothetical protein